MGFPRHAPKLSGVIGPLLEMPVHLLSLTFVCGIWSDGSGTLRGWAPPSICPGEEIGHCGPKGLSREAFQGPQDKHHPGPWPSHSLAVQGDFKAFPQYTNTQGKGECGKAWARWHLALTWGCCFAAGKAEVIITEVEGIEQGRI